MFWFRLALCAWVAAHHADDRSRVDLSGALQRACISAVEAAAAAATALRVWWEEERERESVREREREKGRKQEKWRRPPRLLSSSAGFAASASAPPQLCAQLLMAFARGGDSPEDTLQSALLEEGKGKGKEKRPRSLPLPRDCPVVLLLRAYAGVGSGETKLRAALRAMAEQGALAGEIARSTRGEAKDEAARLSEGLGEACEALLSLLAGRQKVKRDR